MLEVAINGWVSNNDTNNIGRLWHLNHIQIIIFPNPLHQQLQLFVQGRMDLDLCFHIVYVTLIPTHKCFSRN